MSDRASSLLNASEQVAGVTAPATFQRWLETNAELLRARAAVAIVRQGEQSLLLGKYPTGIFVDAVLHDLGTKALTEGAQIRRENGGNVVIGLPVRLGGRPGAIVFRLHADTAQSDDQIIGQARSQVLRRVEDASAQPAATAPLAALASSVPSAVAAKTDVATKNLVERQGAALDVIAAMLDHDSVTHSSRAFVDALATRFSCQRVTFGSRRLGKVVLDAVSGTADFDPRSAVMAAITSALNENTERGFTVVVPAPDATEPMPPAHRALAATVKAPCLLSVPLIDDGVAIGGILLERDHAFTDDDVEQIVQLMVLSAPIIALKKRDASGPMFKLQRAARRQLGKLIGLDHLLTKLIIAGVIGFGLWSSLYTKTFSVNATAAIEASVQRAIVAGSNSYISQVEKRAGDVVYQGDVLARLDVEDLQLERIKWETERDKLSKEQRATFAQRDRTQVRVLSAKRAQAQSQIDFLDAQIARAVLRAPLDGVVIAGDLSESLGSPVERGQLLFEVASLTDYRLILTIDEADIGVIAEGYTGRLRLRSLPHETFEFVITGITPVSQAADGANRFRLEAELRDLPPMLRPGMGGIAKIEAGERAIGWIWTRSFMNWARLQLWKWGVL